MYNTDAMSETTDAAMAAVRHQAWCCSTPMPAPIKPIIAANHTAVNSSFRDLGPLFNEVARIVKQQGTFVFTVEEQKPGQADAYAINRALTFNSTL